MLRVLITTLGKAKKQDNKRYYTATYSFDNKEKYSTPFFGYALYQYLQSKNEKPDKIVILGTSTSMWDAWYEVTEDLLTDESMIDADYLNNKIKTGVESADLTILQKKLSEYFGVKVVCEIIPIGAAQDDLVEILYSIKKQVNNNDAVVMDVTHGLRYLPMIELLSTFLLKHSLNIRLNGIYYGAFDLNKNGVTPAVNLDGLYHLNQWIEAISIFETNGNVIKLSKLPELSEISEDLLMYNFYEQINNIGKARKIAQKILHIISQMPVNSIVGLFKNNLVKAFSWSESQKYYLRQYLQAKKAFDNGDYLRATILLLETYISFEMQKNNEEANINDYKIREEVKQKILKNSEYRYVSGLNMLRNSIAHNTIPQKNNLPDYSKIYEMRKDRKTFSDEMENVFKELGEKIKKYEQSLNEENNTELESC